METDHEQIRDIIGSLVTPVPIIPPSWIETNGSVKSVPCVTSEIVIPLIIKKDLTPGALSWKEKLNTRNNFCLILAILAIEDKELGAPYIDVSKEDKPGKYYRTVNAISRRIAGEEKPNDKFVINENIKPGYSLNKQHIRDIQEAINGVKEEIEKKKKGRKKKKRKTDGESVSVSGSDDEEGGEEEDEESEEEEDILTKMMNRQLIVRNEICKNFIYEDSDTFGIFADDNLPIPDSGDEIVSKVTFTVANIHDINKNIVGYLIRILVHDPSWNPGDIIYKLIKQCKTRNLEHLSSFYKDPWAQYKHLQGTDFPVHTMTWAKWINCVNESNGQRPSFERAVEQDGHIDRADSRSSPTHPYNVCNLRTSLKELEEAGGIVGHIGDYYESDGVATWPKFIKDRFRYMSKQVRWDDPEIICFANQYFPKAINASDFFNKDLVKYTKENAIVSKIRIMTMIPQFKGYKTNNVLIHMEAEADDYHDKVMTLYPHNYYELYTKYKLGENVDMEEAIAYQNGVKYAKTILMQKFSTVCQLEGSSEFLSISAPMKSSLNWYKTFIEIHKHVTREVEMVDPNLTFFENWLAKQMGQYEKSGKIARPIITFKLRGTFSVYQLRKGQILYNMNLFGSQGTGKSHLTIVFLSEWNIPGTFKVIDRSTFAANQTDQSVHDAIIGQHEMEEAFVNSDHGKKHVDKVNMKKSSLEGTTTVKRHVQIKIPGYQNLSGSKETTQAQGYVEVNCSNSMPDANAIGARYHNQLLEDSTVPLEQMTYKVDTKSKKIARDDFRIRQFLSMWTEKSMGTFAIGCREPFMGLFDKLSVRILDCLRNWGVLNNRSNIRALKIMKHMARQLTIEKAIMITYNIKGAIHYDKPFEPSQLIDLAPCLVCDSDIVRITWTLHYSDWIKSDYGNVLNAAWIMITGKKWDTKKTPYQYYQEDTENKIRFKTDKNYNHSREEHGRMNMHTKDLNKVEIPCNIKECASALSEYTSPPLSAQNIENLLKKMAEEPFTPKVGENDRNGYAKLLLCDDLKMHKGTKTAKIVLTTSNFKGIIRIMANEQHEIFYLDILKRKGLDHSTFNRGKGLITTKSPEDTIFLYVTQSENSDIDIQSMPKDEMRRVVWAFSDINVEQIEDLYKTISNLTYRDAKLIHYWILQNFIDERSSTVHTYLKLNIIVDPVGIFFPHYACEEDIEQLNGTLSLVDLGRKNRVCISPMAIELYDKGIIQDAILDSTLCSTTRAGKKLMGWVDEKDSSKFKVIHIDQETIDRKVKEYDDDAPEGAVLRANGIPFTCRGYIEDSIRPMLYGIKDGAEKKVQNNKSLEVIRDLDKWAAIQQHLICGRSFDDPVLGDYDYILQNYKDAGGLFGTLNYPKDIINDKFKQSRENWEPNNVSSRKNGRNISKLK